MRIIVQEDTRITVSAGETAELSIEAAAPELTFSPLHMLAASLATCTLAALAAWAQVAELPVDDLVIGLSWNYVEDPYRVGRFDMGVTWPSLPEERREAALRVASSCTVEHTLEIPPEISVGLL